MRWCGKIYYQGKEVPQGYRRLLRGYSLMQKNTFFFMLKGDVFTNLSHLDAKGSIACVSKNGDIFVNMKAALSPEEWYFVLAHNLLHLAFGHFDLERMPSDQKIIPALWNKACDIYVTRFLYDIRLGKPICPDPAAEYPIKLNDERKIYEYLLEHQDTAAQTYGTNSSKLKDMIGVEHPLIYKNGEKNDFVEAFTYAVTHSAKSAIGYAGGHQFTKQKDTIITHAAEWFLTHYPLLGGMAASFLIIQDVTTCHKYEIHIAAVDAGKGIIYANPSCRLEKEEWIFVLAHEYLHAGLQHQKRCHGRDPYLWNVACDYVINDWLHEMKIGIMPSEGLLYDEQLHGMSAESIYDLIVKEIRKYKKLDTFRGYGKGDIFSGSGPCFEGLGEGVSLDEFFKNALREGLDYHVAKGRGYLPAGLVEEIRALAMLVIPWDVELARWFDAQFPTLEKHRTYARPSRRQGATPDIPRPSYTLYSQDLEKRTFGVVVDTSGSMSAKQLGMALGSIASYASAKEVPFVRIIFCDAEATDAGFLAPEEIAGRVKVTGRGGTILQPGVDCLEKAKDFPVNGPMLIITDGMIESNLKVRREHAFLLPKGNKLPFVPKGNVFYFKE